MLTYHKFDNLKILSTHSNFARCQDNKCSTSGYIYMLAKEAISWKFATKTLETSSTIVVEFVAYF